MMVSISTTATHRSSVLEDLSPKHLPTERAHSYQNQVNRHVEKSKKPPLDKHAPAASAAS